MLQLTQAGWALADHSDNNHHLLCCLPGCAVVGCEKAVGESTGATGQGGARPRATSSPASYRWVEAEGSLPPVGEARATREGVFVRPSVGLMGPGWLPARLLLLRTLGGRC